MKILRKTIFLAGLACSIAIAGCAGFHVNDGYQWPAAISFVWDDGTDTFVVPRKGTFLANTVFTIQGEIPLQEQGAYFKVPGTFSDMVLSDQEGTPIQIHRR